MEKLESLYIAGGNIKWCGHYGKHFGSSLNSYRITIWPRNSTPTYIPKRIKSKYSNKHMNTHVHSSAIHNNQQVETTQYLSTDNYKEIAIYTHKEILFSYKKEWHINICYNTDEPQKCYSKVLEARQKDYILYYSIYVKYLQAINPQRQKAD